MNLKTNLANKLFLVLILLSFSIASVAANAQTASITLSDSSAQLGYGFLVGGGSYGRNELKVEFLYNDKETYLADVSMQVFDEVGSKSLGLKAGVGAKLYGASLVDSDRELFALGVGGMIRYSIPKIRRVILGVDGYYAPPIVSFLDAENFYEVAGRFEFEVLPTASVYIEYRQFTMGYDKREFHVDKGGRVGMEINF